MGLLHISVVCIPNYIASLFSSILLLDSKNHSQCSYFADNFSSVVHEDTITGSEETHIPYAEIVHLMLIVSDLLSASIRSVHFAQNCHFASHHLFETIVCIANSKKKSKLSNLVNCIDVISRKVLTLYKSSCHVHNYGE